MAKKQTEANWLQTNTIRLARLQFWIVPIYAAVIIVYDAWHVLTPQAVLQRWTMTAVFMVINAMIWYASRITTSNVTYYRLLIFGLLVLDIAFATFNIYTQRGMASRAIILYSLPIAASAVLHNRSAIFATTTFCVASYILAAVRYFTVNFNEGYKVELYSEVLFYSAMMFILASVLWLVVRSQKVEVE